MFLDAEIYLHNSKLHTKIYRKETNQQHYLHIKSEHSKSLKDSLLYGQVIRIKRIFSNQVDLSNSLREMRNNFTKQGYHPPFRENETRKKSDGITLVITYNRFLPNITKPLEKLEYLTDKRKP